MIYKGRFTIIRSATRKEERDGQKQRLQTEMETTRITEDFQKHPEHDDVSGVSYDRIPSLGTCA